MKKQLFFFCFGLISTFLHAQDIAVDLQKSVTFKDEVKKSNIVFTEENGTGGALIVRSYQSNGISPNDGFYIERYDSKLNLIKEFDYEMAHPIYQKYNLVIGVFQMKNNLEIVEIYYDLKEKAFICMANSISEDFKISKKELFRFTKEETKEIGGFALQQKFYDRTEESWTNSNSGDISAENGYAADGFFSDMLTSKKIDTKKTTGSDISLVVNDSKNGFAIAIDFNSQKNEALKTFLFDDSLTKKIDTVFTREIKDKKYIFQNFQVSLDGKSIYLLGKEYVQNDKSAGGRYLFEVTKITSESQKSVVIDTKEHFIGSLKTLFHNDELICLGFYSDVNDYRMKGVAYFKLEPNSLSILSSKYNPFTEQFLIDKYGKKTDKDLKFLQFRNAFFTPANDLVFNAEEVYQVNESTFSKVLINSPSFNKINNSSFTFINYNDIVCAKLNTDGDLIWARNINKKQSIVASKDESFLSYTSIFKDETCYFFVNAREKIKKLKNDRIEFEGNISRNYSNLNIIRINSNGDFDYKEILSDDENAVPFMVARGAITADNVYFLGRKGKEKQLLKVTLN